MANQESVNFQGKKMSSNESPSDTIQRLEKRYKKLRDLFSQVKERESKNESLHRYLLDKIPVGIAICSNSGQMVYVNPGFLKVIGFTPSEKYFNLSVLKNQFPDFPDLETIKQACSSSDETIIRRLEGERLDGSRCIIELRISRLGSGLEKTQFFFSVEDIMEREQKNKALRDKETAEAANDAKTEFLTNVSHEIRTPLTAINGFIEILDSEDRNLDKEQIIQALKKNSRHLLILVNDLLDLTKIESGQLEIDLSQFSLYREVESVLQTFTPMLIGKPVALEASFSGLIPKNIVTDQQKFRQILINLINNSVKYTNKGKIELDISVHVDEKLGKGDLEVILEDSGCGITEALKDQLFLPFIRGEEADVTSQSGLGVGLTLSRKMALNLGGDVQLVSSQKGKGSKFRFTLPVGNFKETIYYKPKNLSSLTRNEEFERPKKSLKLRGAEILVVDDVEEIRFLAENILARHGAIISTASDGVEAVEKLRGKVYDLVFLDLQMPRMDGMTVLKTMRDEGYKGKIVALTAHAFKSERDKCLSSGFDNFLSKPFSGNSLLQKASEEIAQETTRGFATAFVTPPQFKPQTKIMKKALEIFYENLGKTLVEMEEALNEKDFENLGRLSHRLKGASGCYGYSSISDYCRKIENLKTDQNTYDLETTQKLIDKIRLRSNEVKFDLDTQY